jgi:hypothetical protein
MKSRTVDHAVIDLHKASLVTAVLIQLLSLWSPRHRLRGLLTAASGSAGIRDAKQPGCLFAFQARLALASIAFGDALGDPGVDFVFRPCCCIWTDSNLFRELATSDPKVDRGSRKPRSSDDFWQSD